MPLPSLLFLAQYCHTISNMGNLSQTGSQSHFFQDLKSQTYPDVSVFRTQITLPPIYRIQLYN